MHKHGFKETVFADKLNCFRFFDADTVSSEIDRCLEDCQREVHMWGEANQVTFEPSKESFHVLHPRCPAGGSFKMLGLIFDPKLLMDAAAHEVAAVAGSRLKAILRCRRFFPTSSLVNMYKSQVLSYIEARTPGLHHAPDFFLQPVDGVQAKFLVEIGLSPEEALLDHNLAPLKARRDISMLGFLHRISIGDAPREFEAMFPLQSARSFNRGWAVNACRHDRQLRDPIDGTHTGMMERSVFGLVYCYNCLPQSVVDIKTVNGFQRALQKALKLAIQSGLSNWKLFLKNGARSSGWSFFQKMFAKQDFPG